MGVLTAFVKLSPWAVLKLPVTSLSLGEVQGLQIRESLVVSEQKLPARWLSMCCQRNQSNVYLAQLCGGPASCVSELDTSPAHLSSSG